MIGSLKICYLGRPGRQEGTSKAQGKCILEQVLGGIHAML